MAIIAVDGVPNKMSLNQIVKLLVRPINGVFEALNFFLHPNKAPKKTCYLKLSPRLNPERVINSINEFMKHKKMFAYIPNQVPNFQAASKRKKLSSKMRKKLQYNADFKPEEVLLKALDEIMKEMQHKYTGLYNLSKKTQHKLLENIALIIAERLKKLLSTAKPGDLSFKLTGRYRVAHPHFGDFQLILDTLHRLEDSEGKPRSQISEQELTVTPKDLSAVDNVPFTEGQEVCTKYTDKILQKLKVYVSKFDLTQNPQDTEEDAARKDIQKHISNTVFYLPAIIKQVVANHFVADGKKGLHKMRLYGEPYLPEKEVCVPFLNRHRATRVLRCSAVFNALLFDIPRDQYAKIMAADGTTIGSAKVVIRSSNADIYHLSQGARAKITKDVHQMFGMG